MNDSIQSIRNVPQTNILDPKGRTGGKKGNKESKNDFSRHLPDEDKGVERTEHNRVEEDYKNAEHKKQNDTNSLPEKKDDDFDNSCGTILDAEV